MSTGLAIALLWGISQSPATNTAASPPTPCPTAPHSCRGFCRVSHGDPFVRWCRPDSGFGWFAEPSLYREHIFVVESIVTPPFGWGGLHPFGGGFSPMPFVPAPMFQAPGGARPAAAQDPRVPPRLPAPRDAGADIPERVVDDLIGIRRPTLAQRAQAARFEGAGDRLFRAGHFQRAAERYQQGLGPTPDYDELKFKRAAALAASGSYGEAGRALRDALRERPDWPFVAHDLRALFPDLAAIDSLLQSIAEQSAKPGGDGDLSFLQAYLLYFSGRRDAAETIFRNPPSGGSTDHYRIFEQAIARQREPR